MLKRSSARVESDDYQEFHFSNSSINFLTFEAKLVDGASTTLTKKQVKLLKLLIDRQGQVVSRQDILEKVWGFDVYPTTRTIDNYIVEFRKLFEANPRNPAHFHSVRGVGYKFTP